MLWDPVLAAVGAALVRAFFADGAISRWKCGKKGRREIRLRVRPTDCDCFRNFSRTQKQLGANMLTMDAAGDEYEISSACV